MSKQSSATIVLALGNTLRGDDGIAYHVLEHLRGYPLPEHVTLMDGGTAGLEIVLMLQNYQRAIIIDAAEMDQQPGTYRSFTPQEVRLASRDMHLRGTMHYAGLAEALSLGEALGMLPEDILIFGVQPAQIDWQMGLSPDLEQVIPHVADAILQSL